MNRSSLRFLLSFLTLMLILSSCRSRKRSATVGLEAPKVLVTLVNLDDAHKSSKALKHEMKCESEWIEGTVSDAEKQEIAFNVEGVSAADICEIRVVDFSVAPEKGIQFLQGNGVLYLASNMAITADSTGQLTGRANLQKSYKLGGTKLLQIPVRFAGDFPADAGTLTAQLDCGTPNLPGSTDTMINIDTSAKTGVFEKPIRDEWLPLLANCKRLDVYKNGDWRFYGNISLSSNQTSAAMAPAAPVELLPVSIETATGLTISIQNGGTCEAGKVFDVTQRKCI